MRVPSLILLLFLCARAADVDELTLGIQENAKTISREALDQQIQSLFDQTFAQLRDLEYQAAEASVLAILELVPRFWLAHVTLSTIYNFVGLSDKAVESARSAIETAGDKYKAHESICREFLASYLEFDTRRWQMCDDNVLQANIESCTFVALHFDRKDTEGKAFALLRVGRMLEYQVISNTSASPHYFCERLREARTWYQAAFDLDPTSPLGLMLLGQNQYLTGEFEAAESSFEAALNSHWARGTYGLESCFRIFLCKSLVLMQVGRADEARTLFLEVLSMIESHPHRSSYLQWMNDHVYRLQDRSFLMAGLDTKTISTRLLNRANLDFFPVTALLPEDMHWFKHMFTLTPDKLWLVKPVRGWYGRGHFFLRDLDQIPKQTHARTDRSGGFLVQEYLTNPLLLSGFKFNLRVWAVITSIHPLRMYIHPHGYAIVAGTSYEPTGERTHHTSGMSGHITNQRASRELTLGKFRAAVEQEHGLNWDTLWENIKHVLVTSMMAYEPFASPWVDEYRELTGTKDFPRSMATDLMVDTNGKVWLHENHWCIATARMDSFYEDMFNLIFRLNQTHTAPVDSESVECLSDREREVLLDMQVESNYRSRFERIYPLSGQASLLEQFGRPAEQNALNLLQHRFLDDPRSLCAGQERADPLTFTEHELVFATNFSRGAPIAVTIAWDDSTKSQCEIGAPLLNKYGLPATFFASQPGMPDPPPCPPDNCGSFAGCSWAQLEQLVEWGHEVASHTMTHPHLADGVDIDVEYELAESAIIFKRRLGLKSMTVSYPYSNLNDYVVSVARKHYIGARAGRWNGYLPSANPAPEHLYAFRTVAWRTASTGFDFDEHVMNMSPGEWLIETSHGLDGDGFEWTRSSAFEEHFEFLKNMKTQGDLWVDTFGAIIRYIRERQATKITVVEDYAAQLAEGTLQDIWIEVTTVALMPLEEEDDMVPLTIQVAIPNHWTSVCVYTMSNILLPSTVIKPGTALFEVVPLLTLNVSLRIHVSQCSSELHLASSW